MLKIKHPPSPYGWISLLGTIEFKLGSYWLIDSVPFIRPRSCPVQFVAQMWPQIPDMNRNGMDLYITSSIIAGSRPWISNLGQNTFIDMEVHSAMEDLYSFGLGNGLVPIPQSIKLGKKTQFLLITIKNVHQLHILQWNMMTAWHGNVFCIDCPFVWRIHWSSEFPS